MTDEEAHWRALLARVDEVQKLHDEAWEKHQPVIQAYFEKVAEAKAAPDSDLPALTAALSAMGPAYTAAQDAMDRARQDVLGALQAAQAAVPLSVRQIEFEGRLALAQRDGRVPVDGSETPQ